MTRRNVLGIAGLTVLSGGFLKREPADSDVDISINKGCSKASIEMHPSGGRTLTGVIEHSDGSQTPTGGQTITGGGSGNIQMALSSPSAHIQRAFVVEGRDLEGPVVAAETCGRTGGEGKQRNHDGHRAEARSGAQSRSVNVGQSSRVDAESTDAESIVQIIRQELGIDW